MLAAEQRNTSEQTQQLQQRRTRLVSDQSALQAPDPERLSQVNQQQQEAQQAQTTSQARLHELQEVLPKMDEARRQQQQTLNAESARQADLSARLEALKALQEKVKIDGKLQPWLAKHGLSGLAGLWTRLQVEAGWEQALEAALRDRVGALEVGRLESVSAFAQDAPPSKLVFYKTPSASVPAASHPAASGLKSMSDMLRLHDASLKALLVDWLQGCFVAASLDEALSLRGQLQAGDSLWVASGHMVTAHSVSFYAQDNQQAGLLARAQEIDNLDKQLRAQALITEESRSSLVRAEATYSDATQRLTVLRKEASDAQTRAHTLQVESLRLNQQAEQTRARGEQIAHDVHEVDARLQELQARSVADEARFEALDLQLADTQQRHAVLDERVMQAQHALQTHRDQLRTLERQAQEAHFAQRTLQTRIQELVRTVETAQQQLSALAEQESKAHTELTALTDASAQAGLQDALAIKLEREQTLGAKRSEYDDLTAKLRASDERRLQLERTLDPMRQRITELQLKEQAARLGFEQYAQLLEEAQADLEAVARSVTEQVVRLSGLQGEIDRLNREIAALGAVNLAALDELATSRERKQFLDAQSADLNDAMTTLEDAIRKIDGETRELLGGTFKTVNEHFGRMFPELFGGGQAKLIMTGDEILDSGVQVMAQPPGKKNQTIHLLSGGEKALTAIALVFAIFQLNPAPFCLLDEVDAPLDDANTERYSKLVSTMSQGTQFLFISHNKIAMEMAQQLIGVTMQEQGVSRIVAVDMDSAVSMIQN